MLRSLREASGHALPAAEVVADWPDAAQRDRAIDSLVVDGLIEAANAAKEQYDMDRLESALIRHADLSVEEIKAKILEEVEGWMHEQLDDISVILLKRQTSNHLVES